MPLINWCRHWLRHSDLLLLELFAFLFFGLQLLVEIVDRFVFLCNLEAGFKARLTLMTLLIWSWIGLHVIHVDELILRAQFQLIRVGYGEVLFGQLLVR